LAALPKSIELADFAENAVQQVGKIEASKVINVAQSWNFFESAVRGSGGSNERKMDDAVT
jgi:hypothetical protein